jgi:hypothetical protein
MNNYREEEDRKIMKVLEFFLSLHEADEIYDAIFMEGLTADDVERLLKSYQVENRDE